MFKLLAFRTKELSFKEPPIAILQQLVAWMIAPIQKSCDLARFLSTGLIPFAAVSVLKIKVCFLPLCPRHLMVVVVAT